MSFLILFDFVLRESIPPVDMAYCSVDFLSIKIHTFKKGRILNAPFKIIWLDSILPYQPLRVRSQQLRTIPNHLSP